MVGNLHSATTAPARTAAPSDPKVDLVAPRTSPPGGNNVAASGEKLPPGPPPVPVVDVERAVAQLNELARNKERNLRFQVDESSGRTVITVINATTKEIVRQIPSEEALAIARNLEQLGPLMDTWV